MFRLAHLSDVHLGPLPRASLRELAGKRITGYVNWHRNRAGRMMENTLGALLDHMRAAKPDHVALTGDLVNLALEAEITAARTWLNALGKPSALSVVPGNHDAYVPGAFNRISDAWAPYMRGDDHSGTGPATFPYLRRREGLALIGLTSARATAPFMAHGYFLAGQAERTAALLDEAGRQGLVRVVMIHHPPVHGATSMHKRLYGITRFQRLIAKHGAELVLHGHTHLPTLNWIAGPRGRVPVVGVSAASEGFGGHRPPASYNLLEISGNTDDPQIMLERWGIAGMTGQIERLERVDLSAR